MLSCALGLFDRRRLDGFEDLQQILLLTFLDLGEEAHPLPFDIVQSSEIRLCDGRQASACEIDSSYCAKHERYLDCYKRP